MSDFHKKCHLYKTARMASYPAGTGYVSLRAVDIIDGIAMFWVKGLDGIGKGHYGIYSENELDEFCL